MLKEQMDEIIHGTNPSQMNEVIYGIDPFDSTSEFLAVEQSADEIIAGLSLLAHLRAC